MSNAIKATIEVKPQTHGRMEYRSVNVDGNTITIDRFCVQTGADTFKPTEWHLFRNGHEYSEFRTEAELVTHLQTCALVPRKTITRVAKALMNAA